MSGWVAIYRSLFDHPVFKLKKGEGLNEHLAWVWLITEASYQAEKKRVGDTVFDLKRGQLAHAIRYLAGEFRWSKSKTERFLARLRDASMIETLPGRDATLITICNYDRLQPGRDAVGTQTETQTGHSRDTDETLAGRSRDKIEELKNLRKERSAPRDDSEFLEWYETYPRHEARGDALKAFREARKKVDAETLLTATKQAKQKYAGSDPKFIPLPATWLRAERWLDKPNGRPGASRIEGII